MWTLEPVKTDLVGFLGPKMTPNTRMLTLKCSSDDNRDFRLVQSLTMGEADFIRFIRLRNQLVIAAENFSGEEDLSSVLIPTMSNDMDEQLKLAHKVIDVVDEVNIKICVTLLRYNVEQPESSYPQVRLFAKKKEGEKCQQIVYVNYKLEDFIQLLDPMDSV